MTPTSTVAAPHLRVLVVDADAETRALYERSLTTAGYDVVHAANGREALTKALVHPPSLVVTELRLGFIDGFALCEILRRDRATTRTPILIVTAETRTVELGRVRRVGADDVLLKPVPDHVLTQRAGELVAAPEEQEVRERRRRTARAGTRREMTVAPLVSPPALSCPSCQGALTYHMSQTGGVSEREPEQWDYFSCTACGAFQYRQRTRKLRRLDDCEARWLFRQRASDS